MNKTNATFETADEKKNKEELRERIRLGTRSDHFIYQFTYNVTEPAHEKTYKMACAPSEDSDQPGHPPSLTSLRCLHEDSLGPKLPHECTAKTLIRLGGCPG